MRKSGELIAEILALTALKPMPVIVISKRLNVKLSTCTATIARMVDSRKLAVRGTAMSFGWDARNTKVLAYGHPLELDEDDDEMLRRVRAGRKAGSGVIAPQPYVTGYRWGNV